MRWAVKPVIKGIKFLEKRLRKSQRRCELRACTANLKAEKLAQEVEELEKKLCVTKDKESINKQILLIRLKVAKELDKQEGFDTGAEYYEYGAYMCKRINEFLENKINNKNLGISNRNKNT